MSFAKKSQININKYVKINTDRWRRFSKKHEGHHGAMPFEFQYHFMGRGGPEIHI